MSITLVTQKIIRTYPGSNVEPLELPSEIARYIEFKNIDILLLYDSFKKREIKIIGVKYSKKRHKLYIAWEFQIIDGLREIHEIVEMGRKMFEEKEVIYCRGWGFDIGYYLDPDTGDVLHKEPTR